MFLVLLCTLWVCEFMPVIGYVSGGTVAVAVYERLPLFMYLIVHAAMFLNTPSFDARRQ